MLSDDRNEFAVCNARYREMCAISATGTLTRDERQELHFHLAVCTQCGRLLAEYRALISEDMAGIGVILFDSESLAVENPEWSRGNTKKALLAKVGQRQISSDRAPAGTALGRGNPAFHGTLRAAGMAAAVLLIVSMSYFFGRQRSATEVRQSGEWAARTVRLSSPLNTSPSNLEASLGKERNSVPAAVDEVVRHPLPPSPVTIEADQKKLVALQTREATLEKDIDRLNGEKATEQDSVTALAAEKTRLEQQLEQTRTQVQAVTLDLDHVKQEYDRDAIRNAALETEVESLKIRLRQAEKDHDQTEQFLASDRDIRELMGARQLYIADVFDVSQEGKSKAYGRIFYTKGKSLIFYAFDLDQKPQVRDAKSFQAWGRSDTTRANPVSLGIFYLDNTANRRWILKADNPEVLEQINSVFVTVEPAGGSKKPSSRPLLLAYLRSLPPNHP